MLFHCTAGKDRTGIGAALILKALGVADEDIMEDYLKTVEQRKLVNQIMVDEYRQKGFTEEQYEIFENYLKKGLEITDTELEELKKHYLEQ